jgi:hypothetical protein
VAPIFHLAAGRDSCCALATRGSPVTRRRGGTAASMQQEDLPTLPAAFELTKAAAEVKAAAEAKDAAKVIANVRLAPVTEVRLPPIAEGVDLRPLPIAEARLPPVVEVRLPGTVPPMAKPRLPPMAEVRLPPVAEARPPPAAPAGGRSEGHANSRSAASSNGPAVFACPILACQWTRKMMPLLHFHKHTDQQNTHTTALQDADLRQDPHWQDHHPRRGAL